MATIKATCPCCGDVDLTPRDVHVTVAAAFGWSRYEFSCPTCHETVTRDADDEIVMLLAGAGVRVDRISIPDEAVEERVLQATAPALTTDDLLDFALWLDRTEDISAAFAHVAD